MATITNAETVEARQQGSVVKYLFRYVLSDGSTHIRRAWVSASVNEVSERDFRGGLLLAELAEEEASKLLLE